MPSIRITQFAGLVPELAARNMPAVGAQIAHNCLLTDGTLRPQAQWVKVDGKTTDLNTFIRSLSYNPATERPVMYTSYDAVTLAGEPFARNTTVGAQFSPPVVRHVTGSGLTYKAVDIPASGIVGSVSYSRAYLSNKPVNRIYAISRVRIVDGRAEEGPLACLISDPTAIVYEGDIATLTINVSALIDEATHIRIYRSITGLDTGQEISNDLDTGWYLIDETPIHNGSVTYNDGRSVTTDSLDTYYAGQFHPPIIEAKYFGLTETGWFVAVAYNGDIQISERYLHHAWPVEAGFKIPETVTDAAVHMDNLYVGTKLRPYILAVQPSEKGGVQGGAVPFQEPYACLPGSMTASSSGAIYASAQGLVALGKEGQRVLTAAIANAGDILYRKTTTNFEFVAAIENTTYGAYHFGFYYGFCGNAVIVDSPPLDCEIPIVGNLPDGPIGFTSLFFSVGKLNLVITSPTGETWTEYAFPSTGDYCAASHEAVVVSKRTGELFYSTTRGKTFSTSASTFPDIEGIVFDPVNDCFVGYRTLAGPNVDSVRSTNGGVTWVAGGALGAADGNDICYAGGGTVLVATSNGLYRTQNGGVSWVMVLAGNWTAIGYNGEGVLIGSNTGLTYEFSSDPDYETWEIQDGTTSGSPLSIGGAAGYFIIGTFEAGVWRTDDHGDTMTETYATMFSYRFGVVACIQNKVVVGAQASGSDFQLWSDNTGLTWNVVDPAIGDHDICVIPP